MSKPLPVVVADLPPEQRLHAMRRWELVRASLTGGFESAFVPNGLFLLVAVQYFEAGSGLKALIAAGHAIGLLLTLGLLTVVGRRGWRTTRVIAICYFLASLALACGALLPSLPSFLVASLVGTPLVVMCVPLITATWRQNCPDELRGRYFSQVVRAGRGAAIIAGVAISWWLGSDAGRYPVPLLVLAVLVGAAGFAVWRVPSQAVAQQGRNPFAALRWLWHDKIFGYLSLVWMFMGLGMLTTLPLRVEFAASAETGLGLSAGLALAINVVVPLVVQLLSMPWWGRLFDRANF
ncbi:MAG: hypothetical protein PF961_03870, partial [Planctomycetota bacterium]|nr:hypothetical protein [Planctomycetota bacterium]